MVDLKSVGNRGRVAGIRYYFKRAIRQPLRQFTGVRQINNIVFPNDDQRWRGNGQQIGGSQLRFCTP